MFASILSDKTTRAFLAYADLIAFLAFVTALIMVPTIHLSDTMIGVILATLGSLVKDSHTYWYGTTAGSSAKDQVIATQQSTIAGNGK